MQPLSDRTASFTDSVIRRMTRISLRYDAVNLSQGFPDFDPPAKLLKSLEEISRILRRATISIPSPGAPGLCARRLPKNNRGTWAFLSIPMRTSLLHAVQQKR